jgi:hypothetical protein
LDPKGRKTVRGENCIACIFFYRILLGNYIKENKMGGHVARIGEGRGVYGVLVLRPEGKRQLGRTRPRWEDNIKMDLGETGIDGTNWIRLAKDRV